MSLLIKGKYNCPIHGEIVWSRYLRDSFYTSIKWENEKNCLDVKKEKDEYKVIIKCSKCPQPYIKYFTQDEVTIVND